MDDHQHTSVAGIWAAGDVAEAHHLVTGRPAYVPLGTTANKQGKVAGDYLAAHFKDAKIAVVHDKTTYGQGLADEMRKAYQAGGGKEVLSEQINPGEKDYSALIAKIKQFD